jgi:hypothetical protein
LSGNINLATQVTGTLGTTNGGTGLTSFTSGGVVYASSTSALATGSVLTFDGTTLGSTGGVKVTGFASTFAIDGGTLDYAANVTRLAAGRAGGNYGEFQLYVAGASGVTKRFSAGYDSTFSWFDPAGTGQYMTLTSTGLGIGTSSPTVKLQINQSSSTAGLRILSTNATTQNMLQMYHTDSIAVIETSYLGSGAFKDICMQTQGGNLLVGDTGSVVTTGKLRTLQTLTDYTTRFQNNNASAPQGLSIYYSGAAPNGTGSPFLYCEDSSTLRMSVRSNGGIANYTANNVVLSDRREKTNFAPSKSYLDVICAIPVQTFNYIDQNLEEDGGLTLGVVAQDVQAVAPEFVTEGNWGTKENPKMRFEIYQTDLQYALMKCIQEQQTLIESLTARLTALENK